LAAPNQQAVAEVVAAYDRLQRLLAPAHASDLVDLDLTVAQLKTLYVTAASGPIQMGALAVRLGTALSTTSGVVDRLVQLGLLERLEAPSDRRQVLVRATDTALARLDAINELGRARLRELLAGMRSGEDLAVVRRAVELLTEAVARQLSTEGTTEDTE
jgi:DNA-binding MarR family transcriptional regulator